ncbi:MAG: hypothetical protein BGO98_31945 [Myxococcales bacterium 68-20]|nr:MAG: hypothetical protein BGO98_31945 [Myxococcales bacterium 68-20]
MLGLARSVTSIGVVLAVSSFTTSTRAAPATTPATVRVDWPTVPGCPDAKSVVARVHREMERAAAVETVLARTEIQPPAARGDPWRVWIRTRTIRGAGERMLEADTCAELARASALLVALAAMRAAPPARSDEIAELMPSSDRTPEPESLALSRPLEPPRQAQWPAPREERRSRFIVSGGTWTGAGVLPSLAWGPTVAGSYETGPWSARLSVRAAVPQAQVLGTLGATFDALGVAADLCRAGALVHVATFTTRVCGGVELDAIRARGKGSKTADAVRAEAVPFFGLGASWSPARNVQLGLDVRAGPTLLQPSFAVVSAAEGQRSLHQPSAARVEGQLACGFVF